MDKVIFVGAVVAVIGSLILGVISFFMTLRLRRDLRDLRGEMARLRTGDLSPQAEGAETKPETTTPPAWPASRAKTVEDAASTETEPDLDAQLVPSRPRPLRAAIRWIGENWIYPVAGVALVFAAVFLVQYSVEKGLLTPQARLLLGLFLGGGLIAASEGLRRRLGAPSEDEAAEASKRAGQNVAATLAGAGSVALFATLLAAFHLYHLVSLPLTFAGLTLVAIVTLSLGWVHGPLLAALGLVAGCVIPFVLGGGTQIPQVLYLYFTLIGLVTHAIGGLRDWRLLSLAAAILPALGILLLRSEDPGGLTYVPALLTLALAAMALADGKLVPQATGVALSHPSREKRGSAVLAGGVGAAVFAVGLIGNSYTEIAVASLLLASIVILMWTRHAPAFQDLPLIAPCLALFVALEGPTRASVELNVLGLDLSSWILILVGISAITGVSLAWRAGRTTHPMNMIGTVIGLATPAAFIVAFELFWDARLTLGAWQWALIAMALAVGYTAMALVSAQKTPLEAVDEATRLRVGLAVSGTIFAIGLALFQILSPGALNVALALLVVTSVLADRRFDIPAIQSVVICGMGALLWRFYLDPGLLWLSALTTPNANGFDLLISLGAVIGGLACVWTILGGLRRTGLRSWSRFAALSALMGVLPMAANIMLIRYVWRDEVPSFAYFGLQVVGWSLVAFLQYQRGLDPDADRAMRIVSRVLTGLYALAALASWGVAVGPMLPILGGQSVHGWALLNDLLLGYALPGVTLALLSTRLEGWTRKSLLAMAGVSLAAWVGLNIRFLWRGGEAMALHHGMAQGELYTYTIALLAAGAVFIGAALRVSSHLYRRIGLALIGLASAKAFLLDTSGLDGLLRVGAFLALGLSLAGLAWLNTWVTSKTREA